MRSEANVRELTLSGIAHRCGRESERFFQRLDNDPRYCYELYRRAIVERDQRAWEVIYTQYRPLVAGWVQRHPSFGATGEETDHFVNGAFQRLWESLRPEAFGRFPDLSSVLRYLQRCVHSAIVDRARTDARRALDVELDDAAATDTVASHDTESEVLGDLENDTLWQWVGERLQDEKERHLIYSCYALGLKPREIAERYSGLFDDVSDVYRVKRNVLSRLRRDPELHELLT
jgi:RNA polymerase sigma factor (sigma-70 family)